MVLLSAALFITTELSEISAAILLTIMLKGLEALKAAQFITAEPPGNISGSFINNSAQITSSGA